MSRRAGRGHLASLAFDSRDELPPDMDDASLYLVVRHRHALDLGCRLLLDFIEAHRADDLDAARSCFRKRGAGARNNGPQFNGLEVALPWVGRQRPRAVSGQGVSPRRESRLRLAGSAT